jgi:hypothetical protein
MSDRQTDILTERQNDYQTTNRNISTYKDWKRVRWRGKQTVRLNKDIGRQRDKCTVKNTYI